MEDIRKNKISIYLLREDKTKEEFLKQQNFKSIYLDEDSHFYYDKTFPKPPDWMKSFFNGSLNIEFFNQSTKGVLVTKIKINQTYCYFAIPFGYGHNMIEKIHCVDDFGLKVVLNLVDRENIRRISKRTLASEPKNTIEQLAKLGSLDDFGIDVEQDLIEEVVGKPKDVFFGNVVIGKTAFTTTVDVNIQNIKFFLKKTFLIYKKNTYKKDFEFIDQIKHKTDVDDLNEKLLKKIKNDKDSGIWLAIPEIVEWEHVSGFSYSNIEDSIVYPDISLGNFLDSLSEKTKENLSIEYLKNKKIICVSARSDEEYTSWSVFKCIYAEIQDDGKQFFLNNGKWYEVAKDFVDSVERSYKSTVSNSSNIKLIDCDSSLDEAKYNKELSKSKQGAVLMDGKNIRFGGGSSSVEFCDVYDQIDSTFIHVKNYYGSSALSHLFAQGKVSGQLFISDENFRKEVKKKDDQIRFDPLIEPKPSDHKIIFAIITSSLNDLNIPFFSKVNFKNVKSLLNTFGYKKVFLVKVQKIHQD